MEGFVPSFHGSELCIVVIYIFHIMAQHLSRDFKIYEVFKMFLAIPRWNAVQYV